MKPLRNVGNVKKAYIQAVKLRLKQAIEHDVEGIMSESCCMCKEVQKHPEAGSSGACFVCPIYFVCERFQNLRGIAVRRGEWVQLKSYLRDLLKKVGGSP